MKKFIFPLIIVVIVLSTTFLAQTFVKKQTISQVTPSENSTPTNKTSHTCTGKVVPELTEGPYYSPNTSQKTDLFEEGIPGEKITLTGYVLDTNCQPISHAWLDFWQADGSGTYDNTGYKLRGYQFTDENGKYTLQTVIPGEYPGRTPHIHVKVRAQENTPIITTQLFIPGESGNETDSIFDSSLIIEITNTENGKVGNFDFVINNPVE